MREIKFRAWLDYGNGEGEMLPNIQNHINGSWAFGHIVNGSVENVSAPMQYTGLKDKNGVEIYEGDIVAVQYDLDEPTVHEVVWGGVDYPAFEFSPDLGCECNGFAQYYNDPDTEIEVIGNIHQNPELLD